MNSNKQHYIAPQLEPVQQFIALTGVSLPIGAGGFSNPMDFSNNADFMEFPNDFLEGSK